jgi:hypothetical protein
MALIGFDARKSSLTVSPVGQGRAGAWLCLVLALLVAFAALGCGGSAPPPTTAAATNASDLMLLVTGDSSVANAVQTRLTQLGYKVITDPKAYHDAEVSVNEDKVQNKSLIAVKVNGKESVSYTSHLTATLRVGGVTFAEASAEFDSEDGIDADDLERVVAAVTNKTTMTKLAENTRKHKSEQAAKAKNESEAKAASRLAEEEAAKKKARDEDEAAWAQVVVAECTTPRDEGACDKVKAYLAKLPTGIHAAEARAAVEKGTAAIAAMLDERAWNAANLGACRDPKESTDCDGVKKYMNDFPSGAHVAEAREAIDATRGKLEKLAAKEDKEAERESKRLEAQEKKTEREQCKKQCRSECQFARIGMFDTCVNRCVQANCD